MNTIQIHYQHDWVELSFDSKLSVKQFLTKEYSWIFKPLIQSVGSYEKAMKKLGWKIIEIK
jgi:hypothetical protein